MTGGCGFIGSHLVKALLEQEARSILVIDSLEFGDKRNLDGSRKVKVVRHKLGHDSPATLNRLLRGYDLMFHLAAEKHNQSLNNPASLFDSNVTGTSLLLNAAVKSELQKIIFSSSLYVYGRSNRPPYYETEAPRPITMYGISKLAGERLLAYAAKKNGIEFNILRYLFVYGPRQFSGTGYKSVVVKNFSRILRNRPPVIVGDGRQALDYVYVDDVINATIQAMKSPVSGEIFNIGSGKPVSIRQLTQIMLRVAGKRLQPIFQPADETEGTYRVGNVQKMKRILKCEPNIPLAAGLERTYDWIRRAKNA